MKQVRPVLRIQIWSYPSLGAIVRVRHHRSKVGPHIRPDFLMFRRRKRDGTGRRCRGVYGCGRVT